ncbi:hypothetical protein HYW41_03915 [Candidatus Daviesbacteria bacterium]|nr:hypothetical protein [Candidatus Daviesbacteria bacterium]
MKQWYTHLIEIESINLKLEGMQFSYKEQLYLAELVDLSIHHTILDLVLSKLSNEDKKIFIKYLHENDQIKIWKFLNEKIDGIEIMIKKEADNLVKELEDDLRKAKQFK